MEKNKLFIGNLNYKVDKTQVEEFFTGIGTITDIKLFEEKGFGFVEFSSDEEAEQAKESLNNQELLGRPVKIDIARPRQARV
jgi:RNA recognition motif-containing protein